MAISRTHIILSIFIFSLLLRLWGIWFGLPGIDHGDETEVVNHALRFGSGDLNPHRFQYGSFFQYLLFILYGIYFCLGYMLGWFSSVNTFALVFIQDPTVFYLIARSLSALSGAAAVLVVYFTGKKLSNEATGIGAALLLALCYEHAVHSHYATVDIALTFMFALALYRSLITVETPSIRNCMLAGFVAGVAIGIKFNGVFATVGVVYAVIAGQKNLPFLKRIYSAKMFVAMFAVLAGHFITCPYFYISFPAAFEEIRQLRTMHASEAFTLFQYISKLITNYFGIPAGALCVAGFLRMMILKGRRVWVLLLPTIFVIFFISLHSYVEPKYMLQTFPLLAVSGAFLLNELTGRLKNKFLITIIWIAVLAHPFYLIVNWNFEHSRKSVALQAKDWIEENIPVNAKLLIDNAGNRGPNLENSPENIKIQYKRAIKHGLMKAEYLKLKLMMTPKVYYRIYEIANPAGFRKDDYERYLLWQDTEEIGFAPDYYKERDFDYIIVTNRFFKEMDRPGFILLKEFKSRTRGIRIYRVNS